MANREHLKILKQGVKVWDEWRRENPELRPDLRKATLNNARLIGVNLRATEISGAMLNDADLSGANLEDAVLVGAYFERAKLSGANLYNAYLNSAELADADLRNANLNAANLDTVTLTRAQLNGATFRYANLGGAILINAQMAETDLSHASLRNTKLQSADLKGSLIYRVTFTNSKLNQADLRGALLYGSTFNNAELHGANFAGTEMGENIFADIDFREVVGLESVLHRQPSEIGTNTIFLSEGKIPEKFLIGCGLPEAYIVQIPALVGAIQPIQFYSCFISHSGKDDDFAGRLHSRMRQAGLRVWFAPKDMKGGDKIYDQIDRAIQVHDRLLLVLSENSLKSKWVETEIRKARKVELKEDRRKLFPIRLVSYEALQEWVCIDSTTGEDLAEEVRSYFIPDFTNWKSHDDFEEEFQKLLSALKASV